MREAEPTIRRCKYSPPDGWLPEDRCDSVDRGGSHDSERSIEPGTPYDYPLIIKKLLNTPLIYAPDQEIVYRDRFRYTYRDFNRRLHRLAGGLTRIGIEPGDTVAVFDYDSHRFLECLFAIPMMGAVLQMVNWRLSADQVRYTLNHAEAKVVLIHRDFLPILERIRETLKHVQSVVVIDDSATAPETAVPVRATYEDMLSAAPPRFDFPDLDENTKATTFYTTGTTGDPKGVHFTHRQLVLHTLGLATALGCYDSIGRFRSGDVYMPMTPMFHVHAWGIPYVATLLGTKQVYPASTIRSFCSSCSSPRRSPSPTACRRSCRCSYRARPSRSSICPAGRSSSEAPR